MLRDRVVEYAALGRTVLSPVIEKGGIWRVRITWPNGSVRHFGKFTSEKEALDWITAHPWLIEPPIENAIRERGPLIWKEVSIDFEGRSLTGSYGKDNGMLTVKWAHGTKTKQAGRSPSSVLARMMLRELATEEKYRAQG
jgi:hypothetical protein